MKAQTKRFTEQDIEEHEVTLCAQCGERTSTKSAGDESLTWCESCCAFEPDTYQAFSLRDGTYVPHNLVTEVESEVYEIDGVNK